MSVSLLVTLAVAALMLRVLSSLVRSLYNAYKARQLGCGSIPLYPGKDPWGISNLLDSMEADKVKRIPQLTERRLRQVCENEGRPVTTFRFRQVFRESITTVDPKNIQAVLATQFKDFALGAPRKNSLHPLLGSGIVSICTSVGYDGMRADQRITNSSLQMEKNGRDPEVYYVPSSRESRSVSWRWRNAISKRPCWLSPSTTPAGPRR